MHHLQDPSEKGLRHIMRPCYLGWMLAVRSSRGLCRVAFRCDPEPLHDLLERTESATGVASVAEDNPRTFQALLTLLEDPFRGYGEVLHIQGTPFQREVLAALMTIPVGETRSYREIAGQIGRPRAARAVANACGANAIALVIPCHRVIASDGSLGGYTGGREIKRSLLAREGIILPSR